MSLHYALGEPAARARARVSAVVGTGVSAAPLVMVVIVLRKLGFPFGSSAIAVVVALALLLAARGYAEFVRVRGRLRVFKIDVDGDALVVEGRSVRLELARADIERIVTVDGPLGGLRLVLKRGIKGHERIDVPKGGERFAKLRDLLAAWAPIERAGRRSRGARIAVGVAVVCGIFFLPFVFDDLVGRSKAASLTVVVGVWLAMRFFARR